MQTHEWEALLDGTTPGPWKVYNEDSTMILDADDTSVLDLDERYLTHKPSDVRLASHAPAAVAEVIRLRREAAALRDQMTKSAERRKAMYDQGRDLDSLLDAASDWEIASILTRILDGDTDD